ncbi:hypothetical protein FRC07_007412 [Ceratobasidium sp. 392]|nr:hypothetical protein FRC07_007412 [Ceratobasidium sp. 392]
MLTQRQFYLATELFVRKGISLSDLIIAYIQPDLQCQYFTSHANVLRDNLCTPQSLNSLVSGLLKFSGTEVTMRRLARNVTTHEYVNEMNKLLAPSAGFHFDSNSDATSQFEQFTTMRVGNRIHERCPTLWQLFGVLLNAGATMHAMSTSIVRQGDYLTELEFDDSELKRSGSQQQPESVSGDNDMPDDDWGMDDEESDDEDEGSASTVPRAGDPSVDRPGESTANWKTSVRPTKKKTGDLSIRQIRRTNVRRVTLFTICMSNGNMRCNGMPTVAGMFSHSTNTPTKVIKMMSHAGISISPSSINQMSDRMSKEARERLKVNLRDMPYAIAYDNLEITFATNQPTLAHDTKLTHLMTATLIPLHPGTQKKDLQLCEEVWARSAHNSERSEDAPSIDLSHDRFMDLVGKASFPPDDEQSVESLYAWHVRNMLLSKDVDTISPALKDSFRSNDLGLPFSRGSIEPVKTTQIPLSAAEINVSTNHGNGTAIENILNQTGVTDEDLEKFIQLTHGDLGSWEHLLSLQRS